jgi:DNA-binding transcriptional LysR family regulator
MVLADRHVDVIAEGYDVVFRVGTAVESELKMRTLASLEMVLVASPALLHRTGEPRSVQELRELPFVRYLFAGRTLPLTFRDGTTITPRGRIGLDTGFGLHAAALGGMGVAHLMKCTVQADLDRGDLVQLLRDHPLPRCRCWRCMLSAGSRRQESGFSRISSNGKCGNSPPPEDTPANIPGTDVPACRRARAAALVPRMEHGEYASMASGDRVATLKFFRAITFRT